MPLSNVTTAIQLLPLHNGGFDQRTLWDIIRGCIATLLACTWASIHTNMLSTYDGPVRAILLRVELMIWSLLVPEMVIFWALRQWMGARALADAYKGFGWENTHGFFAQMGGFVIKNGHGKIKVLQPYQVEVLRVNKQIDFPTISSKEISRRSSGDGFSKTLILGQTSWFIAQCLIRHIRGLTITPLEISTLSFCALNGAMYFLWWDKPLNASVPFQVRPHNSVDTISNIKINDEVIDRRSPQSDPLHLTGRPVCLCSTMEIPVSTNGEDIRTSTGTVEVANYLQQPTSSAARWQEPSVDAYSKYSSRRATYEEYIIPEFNQYRVIEIDTESALKRALMFPFRRLREMGAPLVYVADMQGYTSRIPTYYAHPRSTQILNNDILFFHVVTLLLSSGFGVIHLAAWNTTFPTPTETKLWRVQTIIIITCPLLYCVPIVLASTLYLGMDSKEPTQSDERKELRRIWYINKLFSIVRISMVTVPAIYIIARVVLLVEAVISLRSLPTSAFLTIPWTN